MAAGAIADAITLGSGLPSAFGITLAVSHLRIAVRDARRRYFVVGTIAGIASVVRYVFIDAPQSFEWLLWMLILVCCAMLLEGLLDLRLASRAANVPTGPQHADAV